MPRPWFAVTGALVVACAQSPQPEPTGTASATEGAEPSTGGGAPDLAHHMNTSFWEALAVRDALIAGDLDRARKEAFTLAHQEFPGHPEAWRPWVAEMQEAAKEISVATDAKAVGMHLALLATTCAKCHERTATGPAERELEKQGAASWTDEDLTDRMKQHAWAANEMWLGLVTPSELGWRRGARGLANTFLTAPQQGGDEVSDRAHERLSEIRALGEEASRAGTPEARARVYGDLVARCGDCHQQSVR